ncbi:MAG: preprotein translocase subunit SecY [Anaerolineae bacterium CG03_land_8_20_14_0_80_58_20]|nr:MAG: preprotein translocase subunit SecY [Anaerolineae bacterium CG03_land_8_20_14_0_80_58_20]
MAQKKPSAWRYLKHMWNSEDIRQKLLITLGLLAIYRLASNVPAPGVDPAALAAFTSGAASTGGNFLGFLDLLSGGTISRFSLLSMGVYPYITAQIIIQLLVPIIPALQRRMEDDPREGRKWMEKWTYYLAVPMAALSAIGQINIFNSLANQQIVKFGFTGDLIIPSLTTLLAMTAGTMFAIWLGELISEYGIRGQGLSLIIFAGIVARMPQNLYGLLSDKTYGVLLLVIILVIMLITIFAIVYVQQGRRNVPVMYPGRRMGNRMSMPVKGTLPLMVNMAGMIPLIFASAILQFPVILASYFNRSETIWVKSAADWTQANLGGNGSLYWILYFFMVVIFTFFYTTVLFDQQNYGENLKRVGAQIPGVNRGAPTQKYLKRVQSLITLPGALFLGLVAILPYLVGLALQGFGIASTSSSSSLLLVSSSGLLIVVGVVRDTFMNIEAELKLHGYQDTLLVK